MKTHTQTLFVCARPPKKKNPHAKMPITTGSELDDALLCIGFVLGVVLMYKAWRLFAKLFFSAALLFILLNGDRLGVLPSGFLSEKVPNLEGSRVYEILSKSRAVAYVTNAARKQDVVRYEPVSAPPRVVDAPEAEDVVAPGDPEESGGWPGYLSPWR